MKKSHSETSLDFHNNTRSASVSNVIITYLNVRPLPEKVKRPGCHSPKFWPAVKSTACTLSSTRPSAMTVLHVPLLPAVVRTTGSLLSFASHTALGELGAPPATHRAETQASQAQAQPPGQTVLDLRSAILVRLEKFSHHRHPGDRGPLAPCRLP